MASVLEYMQLSERVYDALRNNKIGIPAGWEQLDWQIDDPDTGFSAGAYKKGNEIVIAYAGTNDIPVDVVSWSAAIASLAPQTFYAMAYYLGFKAAYPEANITFTGHSLGGGLASLMAVFFDKKATE